MLFQHSEFESPQHLLLQALKLEILKQILLLILLPGLLDKSNRKAMNRNWSNQKSNPALKTKAGNK